MASKKQVKVKRIDWAKLLSAANKAGLNDYMLAEQTGVKRGTITKLRLAYQTDTKTSDGVALLRAMAAHREAQA